MVIQVCELAIHSSNREMTTENKTTVNNYTWKLGKVLKNVESIEVLYAEIPNSYYNIDARNNSYVLTVNSTDYTIFIPPGNYTADTITTALNTTLSGVTVTGVGAASTLIAFSVDEPTSNLVATHSTNLAQSGALSQFPPGISWLNDTSWTTFVSGTKYYAGSILQLSAEPVLYLSIPQTSHHGSKYHFGNTSTKGIPIETDKVVTRFSLSGGINYMNFFTNERNMHERHFDGQPPLHLSNLTIRFLKPDGALVDFNGYNHSLHLRVVYNE